MKIDITEWCGIQTIVLISESEKDIAQIATVYDKCDSGAVELETTDVSTLRIQL